MAENKALNAILINDELFKRLIYLIENERRYSPISFETFNHLSNQDFLEARATHILGNAGIKKESEAQGG